MNENIFVFLPEIDSLVRYNLTMSEYKKSSMNNKFDHEKFIRISEKAHLRSDFRKKIFPWVGLEPSKVLFVQDRYRKIFSFVFGAN